MWYNLFPALQNSYAITCYNLPIIRYNDTEML